MFPTRLKQPTDGEDIRVPAEMSVFLLPHPAQQVLNERGVVGTGQVPQPLQEALGNNLEVGQGCQRYRSSVPHWGGQCLPAGNSGHLQVMTITAEALVTPIPRER